MQATLLAAQGVTGPLDLLEAERGLKAVFPRGPAGDIFDAPLPDDSFIMRSAIKVFPCFAGGQSAVAAGIALHRLADGNVDQLKAIHVTLADLPIVRRWLADSGRIEPHSREAADHSLHFLIAVALNDGTFGLRQFDNERWNDPKVRALMARIASPPIPISPAAPANPILALSTPWAATAGLTTSRFCSRRDFRRTDLTPRRRSKNSLA
jgi:2-methylcitrate dehydratase